MSGGFIDTSVEVPFSAERFVGQTVSWIFPAFYMDSNIKTQEWAECVRQEGGYVFVDWLNEIRPITEKWLCPLEYQLGAKL